MARGTGLVIIALVGCTQSQQDRAYGETFLDRSVAIDVPSSIMFRQYATARIVDGCAEGDHPGCDTQTYMAVSATADPELGIPSVQPDGTVRIVGAQIGWGSLTISGAEVSSGTQRNASTTIHVIGEPMTPDAPVVVPVDHCEAALAITAGSYSQDTTTFFDDATPPGDCTNGFSAYGPDAFFRVELTSSQQVTATVTPSGWDAMLYVIHDCTVSSCSAGVDAVGSGQPETTTFTASVAGGTYHIVVDSPSGTQKGPFTLEVTIQ